MSITWSSPCSTLERAPRIKLAGVTAIHLEPSSTPVRCPMTLMRTGSVAGFGGEFPIRKGVGHLFEIEVTRSGRPAQRFSLHYDNEH
jgi:hypothetical protein